MPTPHGFSAPDDGLPGFPARSRRVLFGFSPWLLVGLSAVLALVIIAFTWRNTEREREHGTQNFLDRAGALIWALEAATKAGMRCGVGANIVQPFVMETARQQGILYIAVIDEDGRVLAHSNPREVGKTLPREEIPFPEPTKSIGWRTIRAAAANVFEVCGEFFPDPGALHFSAGSRQGGRRHGHNARMGGPMRRNLPRGFALIGFDNQPYEDLLARDRHNNLVTAFVAVALALGSLFSLFWADGLRRSRRLLKDTRALASAVVTSLPVGLITCEPGGAIGMVNETALAMLRMDKETASGVSLFSVPGLNWKDLVAALDQNTQMIEHELEFSAHGAVTPVSVIASQIRDEDGLFLGHLFILRDIAAMKKLEAEARRNENLAALGSLAAGVAHEIRNPLSSIKGIATLLLARMRSSKPEEEAAQTLIAEADRLNRVVSQLLEFAKPGAMKRADTNINAVIAHALRLAEADIRAKGILVSFAADETLPPVPLHAERFTQALLNLFLNAVQAMDPGGSLEIAVCLRDGGDTCCVRVKDDGRGMPQELQSSIFTPYVTTKVSGTGLGLAIVHRIVAGHGGSVSVTSAPGSGSAFTLLLPMRADHPEGI